LSNMVMMKPDIRRFQKYHQKEEQVLNNV
jgi:hypothetical protein